MLLGTFSASLCHLEPPKPLGQEVLGCFLRLGKGPRWQRVAVSLQGQVLPGSAGAAAERSFVYSASVVELHHIQ